MAIGLALSLRIIAHWYRAVLAAKAGKWASALGAKYYVYLVLIKR